MVCVAGGEECDRQAVHYNSSFKVGGTIDHRVYIGMFQLANGRQFDA
jgi:hypothetical protein